MEIMLMHPKPDHRVQLHYKDRSMPLHGQPQQSEGGRLKDIIRIWSCRGERRNLHVRYWIGKPWRALRYWIVYGERSADFRMKTHHGDNGNCYCYGGSQTLMHTRLLGSGLLIWFSRDPIERPCYCEKVVAEMFPDLHDEGSV